MKTSGKAAEKALGAVANPKGEEHFFNVGHYDDIEKWPDNFGWRDLHNEIDSCLMPQIKIINDLLSTYMTFGDGNDQDKEFLKDDLWKIAGYISMSLQTFEKGFHDLWFKIGHNERVAKEAKAS